MWSRSTSSQSSSPLSSLFESCNRSCAYCRCDWTSLHL
jgi:hypothetical protein